MGPEIKILAATAASLGFVHTLTGPDHYLPFIVISRARGWKLRRTLTVTALCGLGHVLSSVVLGLVGVALGVAVGKLELIEGMRGDLAAWALISFGLLYAVWGLRQARRNRAHTHFHFHADGSRHSHHHDHHQEHGHLHDRPDSGSRQGMTPWALFIIFVLGPCEPLIPLLMYPAAASSVAGMVLVATVFSVVTIGTMLGMVFLAERGIRLVSLKPLERYIHALAGGAICASGLAIKFLGL